jgi:Domain of unknown function (DUF4349)
MFRDRPLLRRTTVGSAALLAVVALTACSSGGGAASSASAGQALQARDGSGSAAGGGDAASKAQPQSGESAAGQGYAAKTGSATIAPASLEASRDALARRASVALQVKDIGQAVAKVRGISAAAQGLVLSENIGAGGGGAIPLDDRSRVTATTYGEITISVPSSRLDDVVGQLGDVGKVIRSQSSSENVGAQIVDTDSRRKTMQASVDRVRALMDRATDIRQVVDLESELSRRQADLEALESQLASLKDSVAMSPVQVSLTTEPGVITKPVETNGFLAGLRNGWTAFTGSVSVLLTIVGAVLPFALLAVLVALPLWVVLRRRRGSRQQPQPLSAG